MPDTDEVATNTDEPMPPDYKKFHASMAAELEAVKDRIRSLVRHWPTDGGYKEAALRAILRRHLPQSVFVGGGFIVGENSASTQVDILVVDGGKPTLFKDGDLVIVTPDAVRAVIEVKTKLTNALLTESLSKLAKVARMCQRTGEPHRVWTGLYEYEGGVTDHARVLKALRDAHGAKHAFVDGVSLGGDDFFLHWKSEVMQHGPQGATDFWRSYKIDGLAPAYFLGNLVFACAGRHDHPGSFAWFPLPGTGKEQHRRMQIAPGNGEPEAVHGA
ncbi:MAG: DUF6602 domain-containing protein [Phycisphaerales bacterium]